MPKSLRVAKNFINQVKMAVHRQGYPRQIDLAEDLGFCLATISNFLNGRPVYFLNFTEICEKLGQDWQEIYDCDFYSDDSATLLDPPVFPLLEPKDFIYIERPPIESLCYQTLLHSGALVRIKAPGLMGKTSLIARVLPQLATRDIVQYT